MSEAVGVREREGGHAWLAVVHAAHPVEQVSGEAGAGGDGGIELGLAALGVTDRHQPAGGGEQAHGVDCQRLLGGEGDDRDMAGESAEPVEIDGHDEIHGMRAGGATEERTFQVGTGDRRPPDRGPVHGDTDALERTLEAGERHRHQRGAPGGHALGEEQLVQAVPRSAIRRGDIDVVHPVDLQVDEPGHQPTSGVHRRHRLDVCDGAAVQVHSRRTGPTTGGEDIGGIDGRHGSTIS